jgi:hypothetical protein
MTTISWLMLFKYNYHWTLRVDDYIYEVIVRTLLELIFFFR